MDKILEEYNHFKDFLCSSNFEYIELEYEYRSYFYRIEEFRDKGFNKLHTFLEEFILHLPKRCIDVDYYDGRETAVAPLNHFSDDIFSALNHLIQSLGIELKKKGIEDIEIPIIEEKNVDEFLIYALRNIKTEDYIRNKEDYYSEIYKKPSVRIDIQKTFDLFDFLPFKLSIHFVYSTFKIWEHKYLRGDAEKDSIDIEKTEVRWIPK